MNKYNDAVSGINNRGLFLRGGIAAGNFQTDTFQGHYHTTNSGNSGIIGGSGQWDGAASHQDAWTQNNVVKAPYSDGTNGNPRTANETRPVNMSVIWIIRVQ